MYNYYNNCVGWDSNDVDTDDGLCNMIDTSIDITRETFLKHVNKDSLMQVESDLGYDRHYKQGLTMAGDYHVSYHRSKLHGKRCYFFKHSAIEYVFIN